MFLKEELHRASAIGLVSAIARPVTSGGADIA
jgi:hypothetical protein